MRIVNARNLPKMDKGSCDCYVKVKLAAKHFQTKVSPVSVTACSRVHAARARARKQASIRERHWWLRVFVQVGSRYGQDRYAAMRKGGEGVGVEGEGGRQCTHEE